MYCKPSIIDDVSNSASTCTSLTDDVKHVGEVDAARPVADATCVSPVVFLPNIAQLQHPGELLRVIRGEKPVAMVPGDGGLRLAVSPALETYCTALWLVDQ